MSKWKKSWEGPQEVQLGKRVKNAEIEFEQKIKKSNKKRVKFLDQKPQNPGDWFSERRLESYCYYLISDEKFRMYKDIEDQTFHTDIYTLKQLSSLFPKLFCF